MDYVKLVAFVLVCIAPWLTGKMRATFSTKEKHNNPIRCDEGLTLYITNSVGKTKCLCKRNCFNGLGFTTLNWRPLYNKVFESCCYVVFTIQQF